MFGIWTVLVPTTSFEAMKEESPEKVYRHSERQDGNGNCGCCTGFIY